MILVKTELHLQYKNHRNLLSTLEKSKENYYKKYFESKWNNAKIIWKGIKFIITLKVMHLLCLEQEENLITNPYNIANIFNNYISPVADTAEENIKYSHKPFSDYLNNQCKNSTHDIILYYYFYSILFYTISILYY